MTPSLQTLFLPLEDGDVPATGPVLFIGGAWHPHLKTLAPLDCWQPFRPTADSLTAQGLTVLPEIPKSGTYALVLVQIPKQVDEARHWIANALRVLKPGGILLMAAGNDANGNRLEKWMKEAGLECSSLPKNKCRAVWAKRPAVLPPIIEDWGIQGARQTLQNGDGIQFTSQPGLFGWDKIDIGSHLLAGHLEDNLKGHGADFGCGSGYLSWCLLQDCEHVTALTLADADSRALLCAKENLEPVRGNAELTYIWTDLSRPADLPKFDFIVMNPPFHTGRETMATLGQSFIKTAAHHLKKNGTLWMVANAHLPYEQVLNENFARVQMLEQKDGFKIFEAVK